MKFSIEIEIFPDLPFPAFLDFLAFFVARNFLAFLSVFPFFPRDFRGSEEREILAFLGGFPCFFQKKQGREDQGSSEIEFSVEIDFFSIFGPLAIK